MEKYRKKPIVISAMQHKGAENLFECMHFIDQGYHHAKWDAEEGLRIETLEGVLHVSEGDFIIRGIQGEYYPCKPDIFAETYEKEVEEVQHGFDWAIRQIKAGYRVARSGWNGKGMWIRYYDPYTDKEFPIVENNPCIGTPAPWIGMKTATNDFIPWSASQADMLAIDWEIV